MATARSRSTAHRDAVRRVQAAKSFSVTLPAVGRVRIPRPEHLAYYGVLGALAAVEIIDWPIALVLAAGHALMQQHQSRFAEDVGEALQDV